MPFPDSTSELTTILVADDIETSKRFYSDVLGADLYREYGGTSLVYSFLGSWILVVTGGGPTPDKPTVTFAHPVNPDTVSAAFTIRVKDCQAIYEELLSRGAEFLTPPKMAEQGGEIRCFFRDPSGHLFEISQVEGL